jgi:hypothetical protein
MAQRPAITDFLRRFKTQMRTQGLIFEPRNKNLQALAAVGREISSVEEAIKRSCALRRILLRRRL